MLEVGKPAPAFSLDTLTGERVSLEDFAGELVVLYIYEPEWTSTSELFAKQLGPLEKLGARVVAISVPPEPRPWFPDRRDYRKQLPARVPQLIDRDSSVVTAYGARGLLRIHSVVVPGIIPMAIVIGPDGLIVKHLVLRASAFKKLVEIVTRVRTRLAKARAKPTERVVELPGSPRRKRARRASPR